MDLVQQLIITLILLPIPAVTFALGRRYQRRTTQIQLMQYLRTNRNKLPQAERHGYYAAIAVIDADWLTSAIRAIDPQGWAATNEPETWADNADADKAAHR